MFRSKTWLSVALAVVMIFVLSSLAFAQGTPTQVTGTVTATATTAPTAVATATTAPTAAATATTAPTAAATATTAPTLAPTTAVTSTATAVPPKALPTTGGDSSAALLPAMLGLLAIALGCMLGLRAARQPR